MAINKLFPYTGTLRKDLGDEEFIKWMTTDGTTLKQEVIDEHVATWELGYSRMPEKFRAAHSKSREQLIEDAKRVYGQDVQDAKDAIQAEIDKRKRMNIKDGERSDAVERKEIMSMVLYGEVVGVGNRYVKSEIMKLAHMFRKREELEFKVALAHAWFWARMQMKDMEKKGTSTLCKRRRYVMEETAELNRGRKQLPESELYSERVNKFNLRYKFWRSLYFDGDPLQAPFEVAKTWLLNRGTRFKHDKYGVCEIVRHRMIKKTGEWRVMYKALDDPDKLKDAPLVRFRGFLGLDWQLVDLLPELERWTSKPLGIIE